MSFFLRILSTLAVAQIINAAKSDSWNLKNFTSFVAFGDSYTDESRLGYFASHNGSAPPIGWVEPEVRRKAATSIRSIYLV